MADILRRNHLSITESRKKILSLFLATPDALTHGDIERKAGEKFDRVTVYRTLQTFVEKGIVHTIPTAENTVLNIESTAVQLRGQQLMAAVTLVKALGGGWQETMKQ